VSKLRVILLGTGTSHGVPMIGCDCSVCTSPDPRDKRTRSSIAVQLESGTILVDTTPELRIQCLANGVTRADAVLFTHAHADHVTGLDDLRRFNWLQRAPLTCYGDADTIATVERMFPYAFDHHSSYISSKPQLHLSPIEGELELLGQRIVPVPLFHGPMPVLGFRFGPFAYCTDCSVIPESSFELLRDLDVLVLDALRHKPHPTHFTLEQAVEAAHQIGARQTFFTHIAHELGHVSTNAALPPNMALGYDGQVIELSG
jgi:phosphoribosyl 1,2-cyclic phosphate phosphodiesterase